MFWSKMLSIYCTERSSFTVTVFSRIHTLVSPSSFPFYCVWRFLLFVAVQKPRVSLVLACAWLPVQPCQFCALKLSVCEDSSEKFSRKHTASEVFFFLVWLHSCSFMNMSSRERKITDGITHAITLWYVCALHSWQCKRSFTSVSYTHLTLPTNREV